MTAGLLLRVGGLHTIDDDLPRFRPTHLIGILDPAMPEPAAYAHAPESRAALVMRFRDCEAVADGGPTEADVSAMLAFIDGVLTAPSGRLFIHCHAGASRSTATAYATLVRRSGAARAEECFAELLRLTNKPWPNRTIVGHADDLLGAGGRMLMVLDAYRRAHPLRLEAYIRLHHIRAARDSAYGEKLGVPGWRLPRRRPSDGQPR
ncbi:MAG: hypothetical protein AB7S71_08480 [Dongiaceae bacterium]